MRLVRHCEGKPAATDRHHLQSLSHSFTLDFLLGFAGPRKEAEEIKCQLKEYLRDELKLELSEEKTLITHARTQSARFLGYEMMVLNNNQKRFALTGRRNINGQVGLKVPVAVIKDKCNLYIKGGKPVHRPELLHHTVFSIMEQYQAEYRGLVQYYLLAENVCRLDRLKWVMEISLTKTLAAKLRITVSQVYRKYGTTITTPYGLYKVLMVKVERGEGKKPLVAQWGGIPLRRQKEAVLNDQPLKVWNTKTELLEPFWPILVSFVAQRKRSKYITFDTWLISNRKGGQKSLSGSK